MRHTLLQKELLLLDGGLGTTLEDEHKVKFSADTPLWSSHLLVENTSTLKAVQRDFANAGADMILTATYQTSFLGFRNTKVPDQDGIGADDAKRHMLSAVKIAREAFDGRPGLVALSLGAYGATMIPSTEYSGEYGSMTEEDLYKFHTERISVFTESSEWNDVDVVAFETLPRIDEVKVARRVMNTVPDREYWVSCVFPNDDQKLPDGTSIEELVSVMLEGERPPFAIGLNCTKIHKVAGLIQEYEEAAHRLSFELPRLVFYPDGAGRKVYDTTLQQWVGDDGDQRPWHDQISDIIQEVKKRGAWKGIIVGGCCKTAPGHIKNLRQSL
ncbi:homocysteine S-methyltransferase [Exophiala viscosa]|uniref:homocysteine S-methyltransferase n=1 Tax=Exophiala viscosa TaxID=2486360 RepID=UPI00219E5296|nr:homocysteine S-methyltransferase [Exophiala viscosa]